MRSILVVLLLIASFGAAKSASNLPIERTSALSAIKDAVGRNGDDLTFMLIRCGENGDHCRYDLGGNVTFSVTTLGGPSVYQLDGGWNNGEAASTSTSQGIYKALCRAIVATVRPTWDRRQVTKEADKLAILRQIKGDHLDVEDRQRDVIFYGSRNIPDQPDFPSEAFVQCGATANAENP